MLDGGAGAPGPGHRRRTRTTSRVDLRQLAAASVLEVRVHPEDLGKVIGRGGRTAKALRTVVGAHRRPRQSASTSSTSTEQPRPLTAARWSGSVVGRADRPGRTASAATRRRSSVRTDEPGSRGSARPRVRGDRRGAHRAPSARPAVSTVPVAARRALAPAGCWSRFDGVATGRRRGAARRPCWWSTRPTLPPTDGPRRVLRPPARRARRGRPGRRPRSGEVADVVHLPAQDLLVVRDAGRARACWCRSSRRSCRGRRAGRPGRGRPAGGAARRPLRP